MLNLSKLIGFSSNRAILDFGGAGAVGTGINPVAALPSGHVAGDLLIIIGTGATGGSFTSPAGWNIVLANGDNTNTNLSMWWKFDSGSESDVTLTNGASSAVAVMLAYRPAAAAPVDVTGTLATAASSTIATTSLTTAAINDLVISVFASKRTAGTWTTIPAGTNTRVNSAGNGTLNALLVVDEQVAVPSATTARTAVTSVGSNSASYAASFKQGL